MKNPIDSQFVLTFDGQDDYIDFGKHNFAGVFSEGSSAFTISGWIKPDQLTSKATTYGTRNVFFARSSDRYSDNFEFGISESGNLDVYIDDTLERKIKTLGNGELTLGEWHFFSIVFNQGHLSIYLDGQEYSGYFQGGALNKGISPVTLGATLHNKGIYFTGQLANISIWNYPCTLVEIQQHRDQPLLGNEPGLVAYWTLNEGQGKRIKDLTGNGFHGNLRGKPNWDVAQLPFPITPLSNETQRLDQTMSNSENTNPIEVLESEVENQLVEETAAQIITNSDNTNSIEVLDSEVENQLVEETTDEIISNSDHTNSMEVLDSETEREVEVNPQQLEQLQTLTQETYQKTMNTEAPSQYKILAIDGGGIRGIIPAMLLAEIEKRTQKQIVSLFDLICGTSSGGILALGLTKPRLDLKFPDSPLTAQYSAEDLIQIYLEYGADIFYEPFWEKIFGELEDIFIQPKYASESREEVIRQFLGDTPLENNLKEVFVTSYDIEKRIPVLFTNKLEKKQIESKRIHKLCSGFTLTDAALATTATPTYFPPYRATSTNNTSGFYTLVDGGIIANNPAHLAILEAQISQPKNQQIFNPENLLVVSLGTGSLTSVYPYNEVKNWGRLQWSNPLLNMVLDGSSEIIAAELEQVFESQNQENKKSYYRFQPFLRSELEALDNAQPENRQKLQILAKTLIEEKTKEIDELCSILLS